MNISEVSDGELSRWIAEKIEPFASLQNDGMVEQCDQGLIRRSPFVMWSKWEHPRSDQATGWHPSNRDMVNDPAMTDMLWKKMIDDEDFRASLCANPETVWVCKRMLRR